MALMKGERKVDRSHATETDLPFLPFRRSSRLCRGVLAHWPSAGHAPGSSRPFSDSRICCPPQVARRAAARARRPDCRADSRCWDSSVVGPVRATVRPASEQSRSAVARLTLLRSPRSTSATRRVLTCARRASSAWVSPRALRASSRRAANWLMCTAIPHCLAAVYEKGTTTRRWFQPLYVSVSRRQ